MYNFFLFFHFHRKKFIGLSIATIKLFVALTLTGNINFLFFFLSIVLPSIFSFFFSSDVRLNEFILLHVSNDKNGNGNDDRVSWNWTFSGADTDRWWRWWCECHELNLNAFYHVFGFIRLFDKRNETRKRKIDFSKKLFFPFFYHLIHCFLRMNPLFCETGTSKRNSLHTPLNEIDYFNCNER